MNRILLLVTLIIPSFANAANHYILSGASGSGSGVDWTNACTDFTGSCAVNSLVRGDTYYVGTGKYAGRTFNTAASGTSLITIKGATAAGHGTDTGWSNSFSVSNADGGSQAIWSNEIDFTTSYWTFDGVVGPVWDKTPADYGFKFADGLSRGSTFGLGGTVSNNAPAITNITMSHMTALATTSDVEKEFIEGNYSSGAHSNCTISHSLFNGWQGLVMTKGQSGTAYSNWVIKYNVMLNGSSTSANHGEWINPNERPISNWVIAFNLFKGYSGSDGMTGTIVANNSDNNNSQIYGNVFDGLRVGNGVITGTSSGNLNNAVVYNNTFMNMTSDSGDAIGGSGQGSGNVALNNLFYNTSASMGGGFTHDYNSFFSTTNTPSETHGQTGSGSPFVNVSAGNYQLTADTSSWSALSAPFNVDVEGVTRSSSRGAYQFSTSSGSGTVNPPSNLAAIVQ
jgi:hypothetical protein